MALRKVLWLFVTVVAFCFVTTAQAQDFTFQWEANPSGDLVVKYRIYWTSEASGFNPEGMEEILVKDLPDPENPEWTLKTAIPNYSDTLYFVLTAVDKYGSESDYSNEVSSLNETGSAPDSGSEGAACFIATAAYGSYMEPHVMILRKFRDRILLVNYLGRTFVELYYTYSPPIADFIAKHDRLRTVVRWGLLPLVGVSWAALQPGLFKILGFTALFLVGIGIGISGLLKRRRF